MSSLATLYANPPDSARANTVFQVAGEFGRQLAANGGGGTGHGEGLVTILSGDTVQGGVYGTLFPESEPARVDVASADIEGLNAIEQVFGRVAEWLMPGSKSQVFPYAGDAPLAAGLDLSRMFRARVEPGIRPIGLRCATSDEKRRNAAIVSRCKISKNFPTPFLVGFLEFLTVCRPAILVDRPMSMIIRVIARALKTGPNLAGLKGYP